MMYDVFDTQEQANAALDYIHRVGGIPLTGHRLSDDKLQPDKQKMLRWAVPAQRLDGKWIFLTVPDRILAMFPQEVIDTYLREHPHTHEEYDSSWFPIQEIRNAL